MKERKHENSLQLLEKLSSNEYESLKSTVAYPLVAFGWPIVQLSTLSFSLCQQDTKHVWEGGIHNSRALYTVSAKCLHLKSILLEMTVVQSYIFSGPMDRDMIDQKSHKVR